MRNPIPTNNVERMMMKTRNALLKERIRCTVDKINNITAQIVEKRTGF